MRNLSFPIINRIKLSHFSLYTLEDPIEFRLDTGILCLAGANGLGKSTFLQVINYGLTGVVFKPDQRFVSVDDYYRDVNGFTEEYFYGRLSPENRDIAEIELDIVLGTSRVVIRRGFVDPSALHSLIVYNGAAIPKEYSDSSPEERNQIFEDMVVNKVGLSSFKEFVFVQSFVLTFDERRLLLFWEPKVLETCLLIFLGAEKNQRDKAEHLRREMERAESRVRNLVYDIKQAKDSLAEFEATLKGQKNSNGDATTYADFELLSDRATQAAKDVAAIEAKILDAKLVIADSAARAAALRTEYRTEFDLRLTSKRSARHHPIFQSSLLEGKCALCGAEGDHVGLILKAAIQRGACALCGAKERQGADDPKVIARLKELDKRLAAEKKALESKSLMIEQLGQTKQKRSSDQDALEQELKAFEEKHRDLIFHAAGNDFAKLKTVYQENINRLAKERDTQRDLSRKITKDYREVQKSLEQQYLEVREVFVPIFNELAQLFLGVDLDITLETREKSVMLVLEVKKTKRRANYELSESQRFFIDIALRMAFAKFATRHGSKAPLYIDTPEGSLDLAYEAQAGKMIASFATAGHRVFMTANVNTSQLLQSIAVHSKNCGFSLQRLYRWTELSEVQEGQEGLFDKTLDKIETLAKKRKQ